MHDSWIVAIATAVSASIAVRVARAFAIKRALLDRPNDRSSHDDPVPRLGGAAIIPFLAVGAFLVWPEAAGTSAVKFSFFAGVFGLYAIGLIDDVQSLSTTARLALQFVVAATLVAATRHAWGPAVAPLVPLPLAAVGLVLWIVGLVNIYNFMDGIDGMAGAQAVIAGLGWYVIGGAVGAPHAAAVGLLAAATAAGFLTLNWPPARIFMGDAGSTVFGFIFAVLPLLALADPSAHHGSAVASCALLLAGLLVVWPFLADGVFTLMRRLRQGENIFQAHRSHVYQRLVLSGLEHRTVTLLYSCMAVLGAAAGLAATRGATSATFLLSTCDILGFIALWRFAVRREMMRARI